MEPVAAVVVAALSADELPDLPPQAANSKLALKTMNNFFIMYKRVLCYVLMFFDACNLNIPVLIIQQPAVMVSIYCANAYKLPARQRQRSMLLV